MTEDLRLKFEEFSTKIKDGWNRFSDQLQEQVWFQQLEAKWDDLEPEQRLYVKLGIGVGSISLIVFWALSLFWTVQSVKSELSEKLDLLSQIQSSTGELAQLRATTKAGFGAEGGTLDWNTLIQSSATAANLPAGAVESTPAKPGAQGELFSESLITARVQHVNIKQLSQFAFQLENSGHPIKIRHQTIDAMDKEGYVNGELELSVFAPKPEKETK